MALAVMLFALYVGGVGAPSVYFDPATLGRTVKCPGFPKPLDVVSPFEADWFGGMWKAAAERPLAEHSKSGVDRVWRFTTLPTWGHPVMVRIERLSTGEYLLVGKRLSGQGGYEPGRLAAEVRRRLSADEARAFQASVEGFEPIWSQPRGCELGADGTVMIFEAHVEGRYQVAQRWSPEGGPMRSLAELVVGFTGWGRAALG